MSTVKTAAKKLNSAIAGKKVEETEALFKKTVSAFNRASSKGIIHPNKAAREVSHLTLKVNKILSSKKLA